jgi:hypothetical protein
LFLLALVQFSWSLLWGKQKQGFEQGSPPDAGK